MIYELPRTIVRPMGRDEEYIYRSFGRHTGFDMDRIPAKLEKKVFETRNLAFARFQVVQMYQTTSVDEVGENYVITGGGQRFESRFLPGVMKEAHTMLLMASTLTGLEEALEERTRATEQMYLDGWATAMLGAANMELRMQLKEKIRADGLFTTSTWSPGQHGFEIRNQRPLFEILEPGEIGIRLKDSLMMVPQKSETMLFGICDSEQEDSPVPCTYCPHQATCPGAFSEQIYAGEMC